MEDGFVSVNGVPTHIITWGGWINNGLKEGSSVVLIISGNPGVASYYTDFSEVIYQKLGIPVWVIPHAGHEVPPNGQYLPSLDEHTQLYNLVGQTEHKRAFIEKYVPKTVNIYLIGHSIGCKMIMDLLKIDDIKQQVKKCYMLFPAIENLADTPNGKRFIMIANYFLPLMLIFCWIFTSFPMAVRKMLIAGYFSIVGTSPHHSVKPTILLLNPTALRNVFYLGMDEMHKVTDLDVEALQKFSDLLFFYFGSIDGWCPVENYENFKKHYPSVEALLCNRKFRHAFVLDSAKDVGELVVEWIQKVK